MKTFVSFLMVVGVSGLAYAHDHSAPPMEAAEPKIVTEAEAKSIAVEEAKRVAAAGKIDAEWSSVPVAKVTQLSKTKEWVVQFTSSAVKDPAKKNLFVILSETGAVKAVNFKGLVKMHSHGSGPAHSH